jgi:hypothetical protein
MTAETAPGQVGSARGPAEPRAAGKGRPPSRSDRMVRYGVWLAVVIRILGDHRFQASVITGVIGVYALANVIKSNQARPVRRAFHWYNRRTESAR